MSAPKVKAIRRPGVLRKRPPSRAPQHIHLPSIHVRSRNGSGYDYEEDIFLEDHGRQRTMRVLKFRAIERGEVISIRVTRDQLSEEELRDLAQALPILMDEGNPAAREMMEERGKLEFARQIRISEGVERACAGCGCSESRSCSGGCIWATEYLCSRCI